MFYAIYSGFACGITFYNIWVRTMQIRCAACAFLTGSHFGSSHYCSSSGCETLHGRRVYSCMSLICLPMDSLPLRKLTSCLGYARRLARKQDLPGVAQHVDTALLYQQELQDIPPKGPFILGICSCRMPGSTNLLTTPMTLLRRPMMNIPLPQRRFPKSSRAQCGNRSRPLQIFCDALRSNRRQWPNVAVPWKRGNLKFNCRMPSFLVHHPLRMRIGRVRFVNAVAYRVRKLLLQHRRRTAQ